MGTALRSLKQSSILTKLIHALESELARNLQGCSTVLDLGCGLSLPVANIPGLSRNVGVEPFEPNLREQFRTRPMTSLCVCAHF